MCRQCGTAAFAGDGGPGTLCRLSQPRSITSDGRGGYIIVDGKYFNIRQLFANNTIVSIGGVPGQSGYGGDGASPLLAIFNVYHASLDSAGGLWIAGTCTVGKHALKSIHPRCLHSKYALKSISEVLHSSSDRPRYRWY